MRYKLVIFDFDGTLADSFPWFLSILNQLAEKHSFKRVEENELDFVRGLNNRELIRFLKLPMRKLPILAHETRKLANKNSDQIKIFPEIDSLLRRLHKNGVLVAIVTSNSEANVRKILGAELCTFVNHFECVASLFGKARLLKNTLRKVKIPARDAIYIGDETRDLDAAKRAGMDFGFVAWGYAKKEAFKERAPTVIFNKPENIF